MEDATDPTVSSVTLMCASQILKTTVLENLCGYFMDVDPSPILLVQPTVELAESFSKERLTPMIRDTPALRDKVKESRSRDSGNTILMKSFPGGNIAMVGANAPSGLAGRPRRCVFMDEVDRYPASAGTEGDPCALAERRTETYWNAVIYLTSSPTTKDRSRIEAAFLQSDQCRWFCPCPKCGHSQTLKWSQVIWGKNRIESLKRHWQDSYSPDEQIETDGSDAVYECEKCHAHLSDTERRSMVMAGEWRATAPFKGQRGYHLNGIASPFKCKRGFKSRLHQMVAGFLEAKKGGRETYKTWINTFLAETFEEEAEKIEHGVLVQRCEPYTPDTLPESVILLTASADVQKDRIEVEVVGLSTQDESYGVEKRVIPGATEQESVWKDLADYLSKKFKRVDGVELRITATAIDMRHKPKRVQAFVKKCGLPRVYPVYGVGGNNPILVVARFNKHYRLRTYAVNGKTAKDTIFARLAVDEPGPRYIHFPTGYGYDEEHFKQLTGEVKKTKYSHGHPVEFYEKIRDRNEALDLRVYWLACLDILRPNLNEISKRLGKQSEPKEYVLKPDEEKTAEPVNPPAKVKKAARFRRGFVGGWR